MDSYLKSLGKDFPIGEGKVFLNASGTEDQPGHIGVGTAVTLKSEEAPLPKVLVPHRLFSHLLGIRLDLPPVDRSAILDHVRERLSNAAPLESLEMETMDTQPSLTRLVDDYGKDGGDSADYKAYLPYEGWIALMKCNETADEEEAFYLVIKTHSGMAGRQLIRHFFQGPTKSVLLKTFKNSVQYRAVEAYSHNISRTILLNALIELGLRERISSDEAVTPKEHKTLLKGREPHFDITSNYIKGLTIYNETYDLSDVLGNETFFQTDTLHHGYLLKRPDLQSKRLILPTHGNFYETSLQINEKQKSRMKNQEWIFDLNYPFLLPKHSQHHARTSQEASNALRDLLTDPSCFDDRRMMVPLLQLSH